MPKPKPTPLSEEDKKASVDDPNLALKIETIADGLFKARFADEVGEVQEDVNGKLNKLILGGIVATVLVLIGLWWQTKQYMDSYQQHYLDAQSLFNQQINDLRKENFELKESISRQMQDVQNDNNLIQKLLLEK